MVGHDPVEFAGQQGVPQKFDVFARTDGRVHLGQFGGLAVDVQHQVADGDLAPEVDVREGFGHHHRGLHGLARGQVQEVDVGQRGLVRQVAGDEHRQPFRVLGARGAVGGQALERLVFFNNFCIGRHHLGGLAVQRQRDLFGALGHLLAGGLHAAHDKFKVRVVVAVFLADHQEVLLRVRGAVQAVRAVEHEYLEAGDAVFFDQLGNFLDVGAIHGRQVEPVVHMKAPFRKLEHFGIKLLVGPTLVQVVLAGAKVVQAGRHAAHGRGLALADGVLLQRRIDAAVHVRIDHAGKGEPAAAVVHLFGQGHVDGGRHFGDLAVPDGDVGLMHHVAVRTDHAHVLDQEVMDGFAGGRAHEAFLLVRDC